MTATVLMAVFKVGNFENRKSAIHATALKVSSKCMKIAEEVDKTKLYLFQERNVSGKLRQQFILRRYIAATY